jgi:hypothetical protein
MHAGIARVARESVCNILPNRIRPSVRATTAGFKFDRLPWFPGMGAIRLIRLAIREPRLPAGCLGVPRPSGHTFTVFI